MNDRRDYQKRMQQQIDSLAGKIDDMMGRVEERLEKEYRELPDRLETVRGKFDELKSESGEAWQDLKPGFENAWRELKTSFEQAASRFRQRPK